MKIYADKTIRLYVSGGIIEFPKKKTLLIIDEKTDKKKTTPPGHGPLKQ